MSDNQSLSRLRFLLIVGSCLLTGWALQANAELCRSIFGRADLLWITILSVVPFGLWLSSIVCKRTTALGVIVGCGFLSGLLWFKVLTTKAQELPYAAITFGQFALLATMTALLVLIRGSNSSEEKVNYVSGFATLILAIVTPMVYTNLVGNQLEKAIGEALSGQRITHSLTLTESLQAVRPETIIGNQSLTDLSNVLQEQQQRLQQFLASSASLRQPGQRITALMQLDRYHEALELLQPMIDNPQTAPVALDYSGLCHQRLKNWEESRQFYSAARDYWKSEPETPRRTESLMSAYRGIAFAERQLDHPHAAEEAYLAALDLAPSAEIHFLLARLYEGEQRTQAAAKQIQAAIQLAPEQYSDSGEKLLHKMALSHFGCLQISGEYTSKTTP